ncbi:M23 family metallopeptidase [Roseisolibacter agri]|uniref:M23 family metallopeptidase n=1 Tax=Roseisolibacter agri TaxID=2014610 RepID=UPI0024E13078|nr:M23 family metallopeptidase [Roseisolibacter agri]
MIRPLALVSLLALAACGPGALREQLEPRPPREAYVRQLQAADLHRTAVGRDWLAAGDRALAAPAVAALPLREQGAFAAEQPGAVAWRVAPRRGQRLTVRVEAAADSGTRLFSELYAVPADTARAPRLLESADSLATSYTLEADEDGTTYVLRLQPELLRAVRWSVTFETGPSLAFPVDGRDSRAVRSVWGATRDGGARSHEGIDIFAPRGTPVLAGSDGVAWAGENRLGGTVVFLRDTRRGQSLYYAHLDRHAVATGARVRTGDTLGFVGNTGNARTTAPHLHFGVYRRGEGAIDPYPFVDTRVTAAARPGRDTTLVGRLARTTREDAALRAGPGERAARVRAVPRQTVVAVEGASAGWLRVRLPDRTTGYLAAGALEPADRPVAREQVAAAAPVRARPDPAAPDVGLVAAPVEAPVYGRFGRYVLVEVDGRRGWLERPAARAD